MSSAPLESRIIVDADALSRVGTALADPTRRALLLRLVEGPAFPADLADALGVGRTNVSNHLSCLRGCGLVSAQPVGRRVRYSLADSRLGAALAELASLVLVVVAAPTTCGPDDYDCADHVVPGRVVDGEVLERGASGSAVPDVVDATSGRAEARGAARG